MSLLWNVLSSFFCITLWLINAICDLLFAHILYPDIQPAKILRQNLARAQFVERLWDFPSPSLLLMRPHETLMFFVAGLFKSAPTSVPPPKLLKCQAARKIQNRSKISFLFQLLKKLQKVVGLFSSFKHGLGISARRSHFVLFLQLRGFSLKYFWSHYEKVNNQELLW